MALKRVYRRIFDGTTLVGLRDELTQKLIPLHPLNADYVMYLALGNEAVTLNEGEALPTGVTAGDIRPPATNFPPLPPGYPPV